MNEAAKSTYALAETRIQTAGVMRCCLADVAREYEGKQVSPGDESACPHCGTKFRLVDDSERREPVWKPVWQLENA